MTVAVETAGVERFVARHAVEWDRTGAGGPWQSLPGTLIFVDISGFTNLSEKLARRGRIGAEELTEVLNRVFGSMLDLAYERGGSLLKFGGDALLLLFTGDDRIIQACSAAVEMRAALRDAAKIPTSVGRVALRMSVGLHDGPVDLFRVGASHHEMIITGPTASITTEMEGTADAGEILVSSTIAAALPVSAVGAAKGDGFLLRWRAPHAEPSGAVVRLDVAHDATLSCIPVALRRHLIDGGGESEHRLATVGFVKFKGVDRLLAEAGPETVAKALDELVCSVQEAVDAEGVTFLATDIDADGGKIILTSGVPSTQEDDEGRMLRAVRAIADRDYMLALRIGVNRGHVFAGEIGTTFRATYTVMGDTVNLAARLMAAAEKGEVYASPAALDRSRTVFETRALEPFFVKGKSQPVHAFAIGDELGSREDSVRDELPFVGRDLEMATLRDTIETGFRGGSGAALVVGATGIGKTRLVGETLAGLEPVEQLAVRAEPYGIATPYRALRDPIRTLLGVERGSNDTMARQLVGRVAALVPKMAALSPLIGDVAHVVIDSNAEVDAIEPRFRRDRVADLLVALLDGLLGERSVIVVEDAHWMDDSSAHLLSRIEELVSARPWSMLVTRQPDGAGYTPESAAELTLAPLAGDAVQRLIVDATAASPLRPHEIDELAGRAGGSPLFLEEMLRAVRSSGTAEGLPDSLEAVVGAQIDALPPLARRLLRYASVLGRSFSLPVVRRVLSEDGIELDPASQEVLADFLQVDGESRFAFRHAMVRDVAYEGLPYRLRQSLHLRAGEATEALAGSDTERVADVLSLHYSLGQDHGKAWKYALVAGDRAQVAYANVEATTHYGRALDAARRLPDVSDNERAQVLTQLGDACERAGMFPAALDAYRRASKLVVSDPVRAATLMLKRARTRERAGLFSMALRELSSGARLLGGDSAPGAIAVRARLLAFGAIVRWGQERNREALRQAEEAIAIARDVGEKEALAQALMVADTAELSVKGPGGGARTREALAIFEELGDLPREGQARGNLGLLTGTAGHWDEAVEWFTTSREVFDRCGDSVGSALGDLNLGELLVNQGRADEAEPVLEGAARVLRAVGFADGAAYADLQRARAWCELDRLEDAELLAIGVAEEFEALGQSASALEAALVAADARRRLGDPTSALALVERAERAAGAEADQFIPRIAQLRASSYAATGDRERGEQELDRGVAVARQRGLRFEEASLLILRRQLCTEWGCYIDLDSVQRAEEIFAGLGVRRDRRSVTA